MKRLSKWHKNVKRVRKGESEESEERRKGESEKMTEKYYKV